MSVSIDDIVAYFKEVDWPVEEFDRQSGRIYTSLRGQNVVLDLEVTLNAEWYLLQIAVILPELVPSHRMAEALAMINRINYNLPLGHFEIGVESRQIGYYAAMPVNDLPYVQANFEAFLAWTMDIVDEEHPRIMQVLFADTPAEEATTSGQVPPQRRYDA